MIIKEAIDVLNIEAEGILELKNRINDDFVQMVEWIYQSKGRLVLGGIGKSGIIGRKIAATLNSTGTRALFLHPVEAVHGDIGIMSPDDIFLALSNSGETDELISLIPNIRIMGCKIIAFTGNPSSTLAEHSDIVIDVSVKKEACPLGLAPTTSTTALLAMGDALAVVLINKRRFNKDDFQKIHPGGTLGRRLAGKVKDFMLTGDALPVVYQGTAMPRAIEKMDQAGLGAAVIIDRDHNICGIITDGDIRRMVARKLSFDKLTVNDVMTKAPRILTVDSPAYDALNMMEQYQITVLPIVDSNQNMAGLLHLHDILGKGEFKFNGRY